MGVRRAAEPVAAGIVGAVRWGRRRRLGLSAVALAVTLVVGVAYLLFGALRINPGASQISIRVNLLQSGGLLPGQDVTMRGVAIGKVDAVQLHESGVVALVRVSSEAKIPADTAVRVSGLSPAGEQYLDFRPVDSAGPYLTDDAVIDSRRTTTPTPIAEVLEALQGTLDQVNPEELSIIVQELGVSPQGVDKLDSIVNGGIFMLSTLHTALPNTTSLLKSSKVILGTLGETAPQIQAMSADLRNVFSGVARMDGGFRQLVEQGPSTLSAVDAMFTDNSPTMVALLGNLVTISKLSYLRVPALEAIFPDHRGSVLEAIGSTFRDGGTWGIVDVYGRYVCDYDLPRKPPAIPDYPEPYLYTYCNDPDPAILVRGARNAPHPPGQEYLSGPPPGVDPRATADPTPRGPLSIPTPYGGQQVPLPLPPQ
ncbi:MCE family protein [Gordonia sp. zg691]|uniref:MCE family protein n=1 Tax=Gordonia jinghuaiqii TaxID=2758710 RepID=A0A7D7LTY0_9ACTN|nr:MlaD family protein [Gordonia jinghuaiqii]MBD0862509.1 MCE family protein [Gordonia jinghuaiqii]MCR5976610.1 MCE family protein [Gordonia jinghuaiqii]QMS99798.1 MCE family protein [Gordonia jinghuaiqii]